MLFYFKLQSSLTYLVFSEQEMKSGSNRVYIPVEEMGEHEKVEITGQAVWKNKTG